MNKANIIDAIVRQLEENLQVVFTAARKAHAAAVDPESQPDNKYDTLALETSYVAQGQANRASEIRDAVQAYRELSMVPVDDKVRLASFVTLEFYGGEEKLVFIGPLEGGLKLCVEGKEIVVITPGSPLGSQLIGKEVGDVVPMGSGSNRVEYEIMDIR